MPNLFLELARVLRVQLHVAQVALGLRVALEAILVSALLLAHLAGRSVNARRKAGDGARVALPVPTQLLQTLGLDAVGDGLGREEAATHSGNDAQSRTRNGEDNTQPVGLTCKSLKTGATQPALRQYGSFELSVCPRLRVCTSLIMTTGTSALGLAVGRSAGGVVRAVVAPESAAAVILATSARTVALRARLHCIGASTCALTRAAGDHERAAHAQGAGGRSERHYARRSSPRDDRG